MRHILLLLLLLTSLCSCTETEEQRDERIKTAIQDSLNVDVVKIEGASLSDLRLLQIDEINMNQFLALKTMELETEIRDWEEIQIKWEQEVESYEVAIQLMNDTIAKRGYGRQMDTAKENVAKAKSYLAEFKKQYTALTEQQKNADSSQTGGYVVATSFAFSYGGAVDTVKAKYLVSKDMHVDVYPEKAAARRPASSYTTE
ncbi:MAG: hypothetical protein JNL72_14955 [Flavipsychrobacter sp.]|nr:hypothetical protein [Flavipsychrobacter sp.]